MWFWPMWYRQQYLMGFLFPGPVIIWHRLWYKSKTPWMWSPINNIPSVVTGVGFHSAMKSCDSPTPCGIVHWTPSWWILDVLKLNIMVVDERNDSFHQYITCCSIFGIIVFSLQSEPAYTLLTPTLIKMTFLSKLFILQLIFSADQIKNKDNAQISPH